MSTLELLERAHARLTELRDAAIGGTWEAYSVPDERRKAGYSAVAAGDQEIVVARYAGGFLDAYLIASLHRTIDAQLAVLSAEIQICRDMVALGDVEFESGPVDDLARAILGEEA